jgi:hypothetical protein
MLKLILIFSSFAFLISKPHILNIEQGEEKVSMYLDSVNPYEWKTDGNQFKYFFNLSVDANENVNPIDSSIGISNDRFPEIKIYKISDDSQLYSYEINRSDNCLLFNYMDQGKAIKDPSINCNLTIPKKEFDISENNDDKFKADKILSFRDFNIFLKNGRLYLAKYDKNIFYQFDDLSKFLNELEGKQFLDVISYEENSSRKIFLLCHNEDEIFVFTIVINFPEGMKFNMLHKINKTEKSLKYNSITTFGHCDIVLYIVYSHTDIALAKIINNDVEKKQILDSDKKPLDVYDAKFSTTAERIFILVKGKGLYAYDYIHNTTINFLAHPYLTQFEKASSDGRVDYEYVGVYVDQGQKDIPEVFIELLYLKDKFYLNKAFTTNELKFENKFIASDNFYYLYSQGVLYLLPARRPNKLS